jgi:hypothetical protein
MNLAILTHWHFGAARNLLRIDVSEAHLSTSNPQLWQHPGPFHLKHLCITCGNYHEILNITLLLIKITYLFGEFILY